MENLKAKVAVVTGAASGIGLAIAQRLAGAGMRVMMADIEAPALEKATAALAESGADVRSMVIDVARREQVGALAERTFEELGNVHVLVNNAGVNGGSGPIWAIPQQDWDWIMSINLYGIVNCLQAFVPRMLEAGEEGVIINQSSQVGLSSGTSSVYGISKHAILRVSEGLHYDLMAAKSKLTAAVICPGAVATNFIHSERNRSEATRPAMSDEQREAAEARRANVHEWIQANGIPPEAVADAVMEALQSGRFYILTHPETSKNRVQIRAEGIINETGPPPELA